jgi:hypothetical protein
VRAWTRKPAIIAAKPAHSIDTTSSSWFVADSTAAGRQLQRAGQTDEQIDQPHGDRDPEHHLQCHPQLGEPGIGTRQPIHPIAPPGASGARPGRLDEVAVGRARRLGRVSSALTHRRRPPARRPMFEVDAC